MSQDANGKRYKNELNDWAQQVWILPNLEDKKLIALDMIDNFEFKAKQAEFINKINKARKGSVIDILVGDIILAAEGLGTIKSKAYKSYNAA